MPFTDPGAERAIIGCITAGTFSEIPVDILIPCEAFHDPVARIVYSAAIGLGTKGQPAYIGSVNALLEGNGQYREIQKALHPSSWECWSNNPDESYANMPHPILADCLSRIHHRYIEREGARIGLELNSGILTIPAAFEALSELQSNGNGQFKWDRFKDREFSTSRLHDPPEILFTLKGCDICTPGNLTSIFAQVKAGKSAAVGAIIGAAIAENPGGDFLHWGASLNLQGHALIHIDSEQSYYDHDQIIIRALRRAGLEHPPPWLHSFCLTEYTVEERREFIKQALKRYQRQHAGIFGVLIDGIGDLVKDINSMEESNEVVQEMHTSAIVYNTSFVMVLHENPNSEKPRGHLGSQMERKSESNIRLVKKDEVTTQYTEKSRRASLPQSIGARFAFDPKQGMHISLDDTTAIKGATAADREFVGSMFASTIGGMTWEQCVEKIIKMTKLSPSGAEKRFLKLRKLDLIKKNTSGFYVEVHLNS